MIESIGYRYYRLLIPITVVLIQTALVSMASSPIPENRTWELGVKEISEGKINKGLEYIIYDAVENRDLIASSLAASIYRTGYKMDKDERKATQFENLYFEILSDDYQLEKALGDLHEQFEKYYVPAFQYSSDRIIIQDSLFIIKEIISKDLNQKLTTDQSHGAPALGEEDSGIPHQRFSIKYDGTQLYTKNLESGEVNSYSRDEVPKDIYGHCNYTMSFINIIGASKKEKASYYQALSPHRVMAEFGMIKDKFFLETHLSHLAKTIQFGFGEQLKLYGEMIEKEKIKIILPEPFEISPLPIEEFRFSNE